jgi:hypothetical protein
LRTSAASDTGPSPTYGQAWTSPPEPYQQN